MRRGQLLVSAILIPAMLLGCAEQEKDPDPFPRLDEMSAKVTALEERVEKFEKQTPESVEAAAYEADEARLEQLRAGQRQIEGAQKQLCDATGQC